jgi:ribosome-associated protein YbcJ (S4-like RNA binding protein)
VIRAHGRITTLGKAQHHIELSQYLAVCDKSNGGKSAKQTVCDREIYQIEVDNPPEVKRTHRSIEHMTFRCKKLKRIIEMLFRMHVSLTTTEHRHHPAKYNNFRNIWQ